MLRFFRSLERSEGQLAYYDSGVGTLDDPSMLTKPGKAIGRKLDMAVGYSVKRQVCEAYRFLIKNWSLGDKIFLVGFSRGAYAVRALAGMTHLLGMLRKDSSHLCEMGWSIYSSADFKACSNFNYSFSQRTDVPIHFVGVWDTVSSFGLMINFKTLPHTRFNPSIEHVRHAVAKHEKRTCFKANLFRGDSNDLKQIWFDGAHCDVGGGYPEKESGLAKVALEWMFNEADQFGCKFIQDQVEFFLGRSDSEYFQCKPDSNGQIHNSIQGFWHVAEFLPRRQWNHEVDPARMTWYWPNLYRSRKIPLHEGRGTLSNTAS